METQVTDLDIVEKVHSDYKIPIENIKKAIVVQDYLNKINKIASQSDINKARKDLEKANEGGIFYFETNFESWTLLVLICDFYRRECFFEVLKSVITAGIKSGNDEDVTSSLYSLYSHLFTNEAISLTPQILEYATERSNLELIYILKEWARKLKDKILISEQEAYLQKILFAKVAILEKQNDAYGLMGELNHYNPGGAGYREEISIILRAINTVLKSKKEADLVENTRTTINFEVYGKEETLAVLSIMELLKRYKQKKKK